MNMPTWTCSSKCRHYPKKIIKHVPLPKSVITCNLGLSLLVGKAALTLWLHLAWEVRKSLLVFIIKIHIFKTSDREGHTIWKSSWNKEVLKMWTNWFDLGLFTSDLRNLTKASSRTDKVEYWVCLWHWLSWLLTLFLGIWWTLWSLIGKNTTRAFLILGWRWIDCPKLAGAPQATR